MVARGTCRICGNLRELADVPWCAACLSRLHSAICTRPFGHLGTCDPVYRDLSDWGRP
jgi:hypothetical protein